MSPTALSVLGAILGVQSSAIVALLITVTRTRERLARVEQRLDDAAK